MHRSHLKEFEKLETEGRPLKPAPFNHVLEKTIRFRMEATQYMRKLDGDATVGCSCLVKAKETGQVYTAQDKVMIDLPDLEIKVRIKENGTIDCNI